MLGRMPVWSFGIVKSEDYARSGKRDPERCHSIHHLWHRNANRFVDLLERHPRSGAIGCELAELISRGLHRDPPSHFERPIESNHVNISVPR
jgi:hypothetical protein